MKVLTRFIKDLEGFKFKNNSKLKELKIQELEARHYTTTNGDIHYILDIGRSRLPGTPTVYISFIKCGNVYSLVCLDFRYNLEDKYSYIRLEEETQELKDYIIKLFKKYGG